MAPERKHTAAWLILLACCSALAWVGGAKFGLPALTAIAGERPIGVPGLAVLIVEETEDREKLPGEQGAIVFGAEVRAYVRAKGGVLHVWDQHADLSYAAPAWQEAMARPRASLPWWIVSDGRSAVSEPLPRDTATAMATLRRFGGP